MPASPDSITTWPSPLTARRQRSSSSAISSSRPTNGVSASEREASKRLTFSRSPAISQAGTGAQIRATVCGGAASARRSCRAAAASPPTPRWCRARRSDCSRIARSGVSPTRPRSRASPSPISSPTTTRPVEMPIRTLRSAACSRPELRDRLDQREAGARPPARRRPHARADSRNRPWRHRPSIWRCGRRSGATAAATAPWKARIRSAMSSGSSWAVSSVEPTRSQNRTSIAAVRAPRRARHCRPARSASSRMARKQPQPVSERNTEIAQMLIGQLRPAHRLRSPVP